MSLLIIVVSFLGAPSSDYLLDHLPWGKLAAMLWGSPVERLMWQGMKASKNHLSELGSPSTSVKPSDEIVAPANS